MADPYLGEIRMFAGNYAPVGWAKCDGQDLPINQYEALYSIIGCIYGGDERTTFNLPDLRGRTPIGGRTGPGLSAYVIGQSGGLSNVSLTQNNLPSHTHSMTANNVNATAKTLSQDGTSVVAKPNVTRGSSSQLKNAYSSPGSGQQISMSNAAVTSTGGSGSHQNRQPCMAINFIFCMNGIFPTRN